jgi:hypothetical protein
MLFDTVYVHDTYTLLELGHKEVVWDIYYISRVKECLNCVGKLKIRLIKYRCHEG